MITNTKHTSTTSHKGRRRCAGGATAAFARKQYIRVDDGGAQQYCTDILNDAATRMRELLRRWGSTDRTRMRGVPADTTMQVQTPDDKERRRTATAVGNFKK